MNEVQSIIATLKRATGLDYSGVEEEIREMLEKELYNGHYDAILENGPRELLFVQEDEYGNNEEDYPDWDYMICQAEGFYVFFND